MPDVPNWLSPVAFGATVALVIVSIDSLARDKRIPLWLQYALFVAIITLASSSGWLR